MTRLLVPDMFGVMAIAQLILIGLFLFSDVGLQPSVIQSRRGSEPAFLNTVWTTQILRGIVLWFVALLISFVIYIAQRHDLFPAASVYSNHLLPYVVIAVSFTAIISSFESTKVMEAGRKLSLALITKIDICAQLIGLFVMVAWGIVDHSIWALIAGSMVSALAKTIASHLWLSGTINRWHFEKTAFREIIKFGRWIFLSSVLFFFASNGDRFILGGLVDAKVLGTYVIAFTMFNAIDSLLTKIIVDVSFPALSEIIRERPTNLTIAYYKVHALIASFAYFCCGVLFISGEAIVRSLYDSRYQQSGWILEILSLTLLTLPLRIATQSFLAVGVERVYFLIHAARIITLFCALPFGFYVGGLFGAIWGIVLSYFASAPITIIFARRYRMFDLRRELFVLLVLIPGMVVGELLKLSLDLLKH